MRRTLAALSLCFLSSLVAAGCGFGVSQSAEHDPDAGPPPDGGPVPCTSLPPSTACTSSCTGQTQSYVCENDVWICPAETCPTPPPPGCSGTEPTCYDCNGAVVAPLCEGSYWQCPVYGCPIEVDAGCGEPPPGACEGTVPCTGETWALTCDGEGHWTCTLEGECQDFPDGGPPDTGPPDTGPPDATPPDPPPPSPFACVNVGCDPETSYCQITTGGAVVDGGGFGAQCIPLPTTCSAGEATCACVQSLQGIGCACVEQHGDVTVTCEIP